MTAEIKGCHYLLFKILKQICICYIYFIIEIHIPLEENKKLATFIFGRNVCTAQLLQLNIGHILYMVCVTAIKQTM